MFTEGVAETAARGGALRLSYWIELLSVGDRGGERRCSEYWSEDVGGAAHLINSRSYRPSRVPGLRGRERATTKEEAGLFTALRFGRDDRFVGDVKKTFASRIPP